MITCIIFLVIIIKNFNNYNTLEAPLLSALWLLALTLIKKVQHWAGLMTYNYYPHFFVHSILPSSILLVNNPPTICHKFLIKEKSMW